MILVDRALEEREAAGKPIRVGLVGAGFMARGTALQIERSVPGMELVAVSNRSVERAEQAYTEAGRSDVARVESVADLERAIDQGRAAVTDDASLLCEAGQVDVILEITGAVEFGAQVASGAIENGKHFVTMNAELDGTLGPILKVQADRAGVVFSGCDGDQPAVQLNLFRFVKGIGVRPVLCGNIKGLHDPYRNPTTQEGFAKQWGQNPQMVTSFADGTKISYEQAIVANATGMQVARRGMFGPTVEGGAFIEEAASWYPSEALLEGSGIVDYVVGAKPAPGVFVLGTHDDPVHKHYLKLYKLGEGPFYCFYTPYHLCHFEAQNSVARAALFHDASIAPLGEALVEVVTAAKVDLQAGSEIDGMGGYMTYGLAENADVTAAERLLPMGLAEGATLKRDVAKDRVLTYDDVELAPGSPLREAAPRAGPALRRTVRVDGSGRRLIVAAPTVTIGIPLFRRRQYVAEALRCAAEQDYEDLDILVSDNGENGEDLESWVGERMGGRPFRYRRNRSTVPLARHFSQLIEEARGEYFVLLCDDDEISPGYVSALASRLVADPEVAAAIARVELVDEAGHRRPKPEAPFPAGIHSAGDFIRIWCGHEYDFGSFVTNMARTAELLAAGGYPDFVKGNSIDNALLIAVTAGRKVALVEDATFRYRIYEESTGLAVDYRELGKAQRQFFTYLDTHPALVAFGQRDPEVWGVMKARIVEMAWRTYRHRWKNLYRDRLSTGAWARAAFQMPFIPAYYREVLPHLVKTVLRGR